MQTFLPFKDFNRSAQALDSKRLSKQILETCQILNALAGGKGYANHPVTLSWQGYEDALRLYGLAVLTEYRKRGGLAYLGYEARFGNPSPQSAMPSWLGKECFHQGHRGHLFRKDAHTYVAFSGDSTFPLLYPYKTSFVERLAEGRFRPYLSTASREYSSVQKAWENRARDHMCESRNCPTTEEGDWYELARQVSDH